jgi:hypothetical protein
MDETETETETKAMRMAIRIDSDVSYLSALLRLDEVEIASPILGRWPLPEGPWIEQFDTPELTPDGLLLRWDRHVVIHFADSMPEDVRTAIDAALRAHYRPWMDETPGQPALALVLWLPRDADGTRVIVHRVATQEWLDRFAAVRRARTARWEAAGSPLEEQPVRSLTPWEEGKATPEEMEDFGIYEYDGGLRQL